MMARQSGIGKHELVVVAIAVSILVAAFLLRIPYIQAETERLEVEQTVRNIRLGVQHAIGEHIMNGQENRIAEVAATNPIDLLENEPKGYNRLANRPQAPGEWTYDNVRHELAYKPRFRQMFFGAQELRWTYTSVVDSAGHSVAVHLVAVN